MSTSRLHDPSGRRACFRYFKNILGEGPWEPLCGALGSLAINQGRDAPTSCALRTPGPPPFAQAFGSAMFISSKTLEL